MNKKNILFLFLGIITCIFFIIFFLLYTGKIWFNNPSFDKYPIQGIDISHHQNKIDWDKVKTENFTFVFMKATEGGDFKDKRFKENWSNAKRINLEVGAYHFFTFNTKGRKQALNFIETVPNEKNMLPPVIDLEFTGNSKNQLSESELIKELNIFIIELKKHYNKNPILYITYDFYNKYLKKENLNYPIWIRDIFKYPDLDRAWDFWQYSNRGNVQGISTYVDLNVFKGNKEDLIKLKQKAQAHILE